PQETEVPSNSLSSTTRGLTAASAQQSSVERGRPMSRRRFLAGGAAAGLLFGSVALWKVKSGTGRAPIKTTDAPDNVDVSEDDEAWRSTVSKLPPEEQRERVRKRLMKLNPGFNGDLKCDIRRDVIEHLEFLSDEVTNLSPVAALGRLKSVDFSGSKPG